MKFVRLDTVRHLARRRPDHQGQPVNAGGPDVVFATGTAAHLLDVRVNIHGTRVVNGVLAAATVTFE